MPRPNTALIARARLAAARIGLAAVGLAVGLLAAEALARALGPQGPEYVVDARLTVYEPALYQPHRERITTLAPGADVTLRAVEYETHVRTNRHGLRGGELGPKNPDTLRVLAIGDSFTLAVQVDETDTFAARIEPLLSERLGRPVAVMNAGVDGYGPAQAVHRLQELSRPLGVDAVVYTLFAGNDLRDDATLADRLALASKQPARRGPPPAHHPEDPELSAMRHGTTWARRSRLVAWVQVVAALRAQATDFRIQEYADELRQFTDPDLRARLLPHTQRSLSTLAHTCQHQRLACIVAVAPPAWAVDDSRRAPTFNAFGLNADSADYDAFLDDLQRVVPPTLTVVDLRRALTKAPDPAATYLTFDPHWSAQGHAAVAPALADALAGVVTRP